MADVVISADEEGETSTDAVDGGTPGAGSNQPSSSQNAFAAPTTNESNTSTTQPSHQQPPPPLSSTSTTAPNRSESVDPQEQFRSLQALWDNDREPEDLVSTFKQMSEIVEHEVCEYYKLDPDPFDDRNPDEQNPDYVTSPFGRILNEIDELFIEKLIDLYILPSNRHSEVLPLACRLLYNILPASISFSFETDNMREAGSLLEKLLTVARETDYDQPLKYYVLALLAQGSSVQCPFSNSANHAAFEQLAVSALKQLHKLNEELQRQKSFVYRPFAQFGSSRDGSIAGPSNSAAEASIPCAPTTPGSSKNVLTTTSSASKSCTQSPSSRGTKRPLSQVLQDSLSVKKKQRRTSPNMFESLPAGNLGASSEVDNSKVIKKIEFGENSNSWADVGPLYIGTYCLDPLTITMKQRLLLQFLTPLAEYQELLSIFIEEQSLELIDFYLEVSLHKDIRLTFEALRFLSGLLCHRRLAAKFVLSSGVGGLSRLISVARPSVAATAVSMCLFYIACCRDVFERALHQLNPSTLRELCRYGLWLLECCTHESGRCHATMFFAEVFPFRCLLDVFDSMDGLRTLHNSITTLEIFGNIVNSSNEVTVEQDHGNRASIGGSFSGRRSSTASRRQNTVEQRFGNIFNAGFLAGVSGSDEHSESIRQAIKHFCVALRSYFSMHLAIKADQLKKALKRGPVYLPVQHHKAADINYRIELKNMWFLLENVPVKNNWPVADQFMKLQGLQVLLQICYLAQEWRSYQFRAETLRNALDVIACITAHPKYQETLCQTIEVPSVNAEHDDDHHASQNQNFEYVTGIRIILNLAEGATVQDAEVQKSALRVVINCVCGPYGIQYTGLPGDQVLIGMGHPKLTGYPANPQDDVMAKMWSSVRSNNGLQVLLSLAVTKTPAADAELLRSLACVALYGLCLDDNIKQIVSRMPLFSLGLLEIAMREPPVQSDKILDHQKFAHCGSALIDRVFSTRKYYNPLPSGARSIEELRRAEIVAQTRISWDPKELLALISEHLDSLGYTKSAKTLFHEAELSSFYKLHQMKPIVLIPKTRIPPRLSVIVREPGQPMEIVKLPPAKQSLPSRVVSNTSLVQPQCIMFNNIAKNSGEMPRTPTKNQPAGSNDGGGGSNAINNQSTPGVTGSPMIWPSRLKAISQMNMNGDAFPVPSTPETYVSVKKQIQLSRGLAPTSSPMSAGAPTPPSSHSLPNTNSMSMDLELQATNTTGAAAVNNSVNNEDNNNSRLPALPWRASVPNQCRTLNNIVESYLESQHAKQHKCPEPLYRTSAPLSAAKRLSLRKVFAPHGGTEGNSFNRKLIHSRFRPVMTYSENIVDKGFFTSVSFSNCRSHLFIGTSMGEVRKYTCSSDGGQAPVSTFECHDTAIANIDLSLDSKLMLTTVSWGNPGGTLWQFSADNDAQCSKVMDFHDEMHCEFTKVSQDAVIGSVNEKAFLYDINTKTRVRSLHNPSCTNDYLINMATGSYHSDALVLNDGVLWDTRQSHPVHKFDKFNPNISGVFHPNTLEVIINSEIWDLRTQKLLQTVPALDQCLIWFNHAHNVIYSSAFTNLDEDRSVTMASNVKTIDACDYQTIATLDVKKKVGDVSIEPRDLYVAIIENGGGSGNMFLHESGICKIYEVGVPREPDQEDEDNSDNDDDDDDDEDEDDDDEDDDEAVIFDEILNNQISPPQQRSHAGSAHSARSGANGGLVGADVLVDEDDEDDFEFDEDDEDDFDEDEEFDDDVMLLDGEDGSSDGEDDDDGTSPDSLLDDLHQS